MPAPSFALLMTDVVDSTQLAQGLGDARMAALWSAHDRAARDLLRRWRGREIEKTDGLLALFENAADAARYALDYHQALAALEPPLLARAAVHVGAVMLRETEPEYFDLGAKRLDIDGLAKPTVARLMALALGGQTLMTREAASALDATAFVLQSHGHWRLKGIADPVELFEMGDERSPFRPPPDETKAYRVVRRQDAWVPARETPHGLPAERDRFVGRAEPLRELSRRLEGGTRLVSILGTGGLGKTRFALHFAWSFLGGYPGGAWFCDLSQARTPDGIHFAVAQGLRVPLGKSDPAVQLGQAVAGRERCLVILDNFEQVAQFAEETVGRWLDAAPQATFLVTSREHLGIVGEETLFLSTMPATDAVAMFCSRAEAARHGFAPNAEDTSAIGRLVAVLDGLPLAIELAAARIPVMSPRALLARMNERFSVLASRTGRVDRQATLRATFDWSWDLLSVAERSALAELSAFEGGWTLESAAAVLSCCQGGESFVAIDVVGSLVDKSFVRPVDGDRFRLLRTIRDYADAHLRTPGRFPGSGPGAVETVQLRHGRHFAAKAVGERRPGASADIENFVVACQRAVVRGDATTAVSTLEGAWRSLQLTGPFRVAIDLAEAASSMQSLPTPERVRVHHIAGRSLFVAGHADLARSRLTAACELASSSGLSSLRAVSLASLAELGFEEGRLHVAREQYQAALDIARTQKDPVTICSILNGLAQCDEQLGETERARLGYEEALRIAQDANDSRWIGGAMGNLGQLYANQGLSAKARPLYEESVRIAHSLGDRQWEGNMLCNLGLLHHEAGQPLAAARKLEAALAVAREIEHTRLESVVLCNLGLVHEALGDSAQARDHYVDAVQIARKRKDRRSCGQFLGYLGLLEARERDFVRAAEALSEGESILLEVGDRFSLGILLCGKAEMQCRAGDVAASTTTLSSAAQLALELGTEPTSELGTALDRCRRLLAEAPIRELDRPFR